MTQRREFTPHQKAYITRAHGKGYGINSISRGLRCSQGRVKRYLWSIGLDLLYTPTGRHPMLPALPPYGYNLGRKRKRRKQVRPSKPERIPERHPWHEPIWPGWRVHCEVRNGLGMAVWITV